MWWIWCEYSHFVSYSFHLFRSKLYPDKAGLRDVLFIPPSGNWPHYHHIDCQILSRVYVYIYILRHRHTTSTHAHHCSPKLLFTFPSAPHLSRFVFQFLAHSQTMLQFLSSNSNGNGNGNSVTTVTFLHSLV